ncbi:MAG: hypothetical protein V4481_03155 [Patescibacteria group bacterium]
MTQPKTLTASEWRSITENIYLSVGQRIKETRKIHIGMRFGLYTLLVIGMFLVYWIAMITT